MVAFLSVRFKDQNDGWWKMYLILGAINNTEITFYQNLFMKLSTHVAFSFWIISAPSVGINMGLIGRYF